MVDDHDLELIEKDIDHIRELLGGYSLAGLFALWAGCFPKFTEYMRENEIHVDPVYLSLGDREERTRNPVMACRAVL